MSGIVFLRLRDFFFSETTKQIITAMSKELFSIDPYKGEQLDAFSLKADPRHDIAGAWARRMDEAADAGDVRAWLLAAMCRLRRMRGLAPASDGFDCVLRFSSPIEASDGTPETRFSIIAAGYTDPTLGTPDSVSLLWEDTRGERHWNILSDFRMPRLSSLRDELARFFSAMES